MAGRRKSKKIRFPMIANKGVQLRPLPPWETGRLSGKSATVPEIPFLVAAFPPDWVAGLLRNQWPVSSGIRIVTKERPNEVCPSSVSRS